MKPLSLAEVKKFAGSLEEKKDLKDYLKKFGKLSENDSKKLTEEIKSLNNLKIKDADIVKIIDFLPKHSEDVNKIFSDVSLDEKETNEIIEIVKKY